jgi:hypothetical protein
MRENYQIVNNVFMAMVIDNHIKDLFQKYIHKIGGNKCENLPDVSKYSGGEVI